MEKKILLVEDDSGLTLILTDLLTSEGHRVESACDGLLGMKQGQDDSFDLIILDVSLPCRNGLDVLRGLRSQGVETPILMLTGRSQVSDKVAGLRHGADDYLGKPFDPTELMARVDALLRRSGRTLKSSRLPDVFNFGHVKVVFSKAKVYYEGNHVKLSARLFQLLRYFIEHRGSLISRDELLTHVWGFEQAPNTRTVDVHVVRLRQKLEMNPAQPEFFTTIYGVGYKFVA